MTAGVRQIARDLAFAVAVGVAITLGLGAFLMAVAWPELVFPDSVGQRIVATADAFGVFGVAIAFAVRRWG